MSSTQTATAMHAETRKYNKSQEKEDRKICDLLARTIDKGLPDAENKIWHAHPVWFLDGNPIAGYSKQQAGIRQMFYC